MKKIDWKKQEYLGFGGKVVVWKRIMDNGVCIRISQVKDEKYFHLTIHDDDANTNYGSWCALAESHHKSFELAEKNITRLLQKIVYRYSGTLKEIRGKA
jgi:hypothetical protein